MTTLDSRIGNRSISTKYTRVRSTPLRMPSDSIDLISGPVDIGNFLLQSFDPPTGKWIILNDFMVDFGWGDSIDEAAVQMKMTLNNNIADTNKKISDYLPDGTKVKFFWNPPGGKQIELNQFFIWNRDRSSAENPVVVVQLYDEIMRLHTSYHTFLYATGKKKKTGWTCDQITKDVCQKHGIPIGHIPKSKIRIPYLYAEDCSIYDFLLKIWGQDRRQTGRKYLIRMRGGKLYVTVKTESTARIWEICGEKDGPINRGGLISASYSSGIDPGDSSSGTASVVTIRGVSEKGGDGRSPIVVFTATNKKLIKQIGRIEKVVTVEGLTSKAKAKKIALRYIKALNVRKVEYSIQALGIPFLFSGDPVYVRDPGTTINSRFWINSIDHKVDSSGYTMSANLSLHMTVPSDFANTNETQPTKDSKKYAAGKPDAMPSWLYPIMLRACKAAGVPVKWATSNALVSLLQGESSFNPQAQNPTSTAYGLFQFLDSTWAGVGGSKTSDPYLQCVYGLKYIRRRYGSPEMAYYRWKQRSPHWY